MDPSEAKIFITLTLAALPLCTVASLMSLVPPSKPRVPRFASGNAACHLFNETARSLARPSIKCLNVLDCTASNYVSMRNEATLSPETKLSRAFLPLHL
jgi:hypothetical protein